MIHNTCSNRENKLVEINKKYDIYYFYPNTTHTIEEINESLIGYNVAVIGRVINYRNSKMFIFIRNNGFDIQCYCNVKNNKLQDIKLVDIGDCICVNGIVKKSNTGVITIFIDSFTFLSKCLITAPDQYYINKKEDIYNRKKRTEYLSFHKVAFNNLHLRYKIVEQIRKFMFDNEFTEVETPILQRIAGGANTKPFVTQYIDKKDIFYLRIAPELYLKRLIISGFNKIFEIAKNFRNEGMSIYHNPEFSMLEAYVVGWKLQNMIDFILLLLNFLVEQLLGIYTKNLSITQINFLKSINFNNIKYFYFQNIIESLIGKEGTINDMFNKYAENNIRYEGESMNFYCVCEDYISKIFVKQFEKNQIVCIMHHPAVLSPLAKICNNFALRFEIYINGYEIADGFEEENNAKKQLAIFQQQAKNNNSKFDVEYINDMLIGFPHTTGVGIGLDRLICILLCCKNIRDVISYTD